SDAGAGGAFAAQRLLSSADARHHSGYLLFWNRNRRRSGILVGRLDGSDLRLALCILLPGIPGIAARGHRLLSERTTTRSHGSSSRAVFEQRLEDPLQIRSHALSLSRLRSIRFGL